MYKVSYYMAAGSNTVVTKTFKTFQEASEFSLTCPRESVIEVKLYPDNEVKKEDRT
jgi:hypothetical protein